MLAAALLTLVGSAEAFSCAAPAPAASGRSSSPVCLEASSRRQAVAGAGAVLAATVFLPKVAFADETEDAMAKIAAKNKAALAKAKEEERANIMKQVEEEEDPSAKVKKIVGVGAAGVLASVPFYYRNLLRLGTKIVSGGEDDGYNPSLKGKKAVPTETKTPGLGKTLQRSFFGRDSF